MSVKKALLHANSNIDLNGVIEIGEFDLRLVNEHASAQVKGVLTLKTTPTPHVHFSGTVDPEHKPMTLMAIQARSYKTYHQEFEIGTLFIQHYDERLLTIDGELFGDVVLGDKSVKVNQVRFLIPNMVRIAGDPIEYDDRTSTLGRTIFEDEKYIITIDQVVDFDRKEERWKLETGGFFFSYACEVRLKKNPASHKEIMDIISIFKIFISFLNGRTTSPMIIEGIAPDEESIMWTDYTCYENYQGLHNRIHSIMETRVKRNIGVLWKSFRKLFENNNDKSFIKSAINWYTESNCSTSIQTSIILSQTALELIYNWLIVENRQMIVGEDAKNINASNKLRLISSLVRFDIPIERMTALQKVQNDNKSGSNLLRDIFEIIVEVRNSLVHSQKAKRMSIEQLPNGALEQSRNIFLYFIEISILYICSYEGRFTSRLINLDFKAVTSVPVPWHRYYDRIWKNLTTGVSDPDLVKHEQELHND